MLQATIQRLDELGADPSVGVLARLQAAALRASADPAWDASLGDLGSGLAPGRPMLEGQTLGVPEARVRSLLDELAGIAASAVLSSAISTGSLDPLALVEASAAQDVDRLERLASDTGVEPGLLATLAALASLPVLLAAGRRAAEHGLRKPWTIGICPVCAAWPTLAEVRGVERRRALRCGRCGADWTMRHGECVCCGADDHRLLGYLAPEETRESRRVETCDRCKGYLKSIATLEPTDPDGLGLLDLTTVELDLAALERGYARPLPRQLEVRVRPA